MEFDLDKNIDDAAVEVQAPSLPPAHLSHQRCKDRRSTSKPIPMAFPIFAIGLTSDVYASRRSINSPIGAGRQVVADPRGRQGFDQRLA